MRKPVYNVVGAYSNEVIYQADEHAEAFRFILQSFPNDTKERNPKFEKMKRINRKGYVLPQPMRIEKILY